MTAGSTVGGCGCMSENEMHSDGNNNITLQCISSPCIWIDGGTLWGEMQVKNQSQSITHFNIKAVKGGRSKLSYSINVKKSINSAGEALFQYVNRASGGDRGGQHRDVSFFYYWFAYM